MKRFIMLVILTLIPTFVMAGIGDGVLVRRGLSYSVKAVNVSSTTATLVSSFDTRKVDVMVRFTNTSYDVYVVTSTFTSLPTSTCGGFPIKSGEKLCSEGYYPGELYLIMGQFSPTTSINVIEFFRQEY